MKAVNAMIVWCPNSEVHDGNPIKGKVAVTEIPEPEWLKEFPNSVGACDHNWKETDNAGRIELMQEHYASMIHDDGIEPDVLDAALKEIDEFKYHQFSTDPKFLVS